MNRKIITSNVRPPIPIREFDWMACREGDDEFGPRGFGKTEQEAIADLLVYFPDDSAETA